MEAKVNRRRVDSVVCWGWDAELNFYSTGCTESSAWAAEDGARRWNGGDINGWFPRLISDCPLADPESPASSVRVPEDMRQVVHQAFFTAGSQLGKAPVSDGESLQFALESALEHLSTHPIVPTDEQCLHLLGIWGWSTNVRSLQAKEIAALRPVIAEWDRIKFFPPEPVLPEAVKALGRTKQEWLQHIEFLFSICEPGDEISVNALLYAWPGHPTEQDIAWANQVISGLAQGKDGR